MTLNEAIERAKEKAAELRERNCIECAVEHEQLATWLEELSKFQWIPVTKRLPEEKQRVLVRCKTVGTTVGWRLWGEWMTDLGDGGSEVTHWMPLPKPHKPEGLEDPE